VHRTLPAAEAASLPEDLIVSVEGISRALPPPYKAVPRWIARVLPKSGLAGRTGPEMQDLVMDDDDEDDDDDDDYLGEEPAVLHELSFELRRGEGIGIVGTDAKGIATIVRILIGGLPPSTGRVLFRGLVAPITMSELKRLMVNEFDRKAVNVMARYFHWPRRLIDARWDEIEEFAAVDEVANRARVRTLRLAVSAALHMDATLYVLDNSINDDAAFAARCLDLVAQRKAEGAAVIQAGRRFIEGVGRLSDQVIWLEDGEVVYRGRPVEVAADLHRNTVEKVESHAEPVTARLLDSAKPVRLGPGLSHVDFEVDVLRKELELGFGLELTDERGRTAELRKPERLHAPEPGVYRLRVSVPDGLVEERSYRARLTVEIAIAGHEPAPPRELVAFDAVVASGGPNGDEDLPVGFVFLEVADVELDESDDATWDVSRIGS
jgi:ABC-type polysaccharide/polyol phosphate transport system ATPase subunit